MQIVRRAEHYYRSGYNCAEAVLLAAAESYDLGLEPGDVRLATGFGGGMGRGHICGAITGGLIALGAALGRKNPEQGQDHLKALREQILVEFDSELGSIHCQDLKTEDKEVCVGCVRAAAKALAEVLDQNL